MANIKVDPQKMDAAAAKLNNLADEYNKIAGTLMKNATTMGEAWKGEDNIAFCNQIKGFTEELNQMVQKLRGCSETLKQQSGHYKKQQEDVASTAKTLTN